MFPPERILLQAWLFSWSYLSRHYFLPSKCEIMQFILLYIQKIYGSKKIIPTFLLDPVFNYQLEE